jgi:hypothetical protein
MSRITALRLYGDYHRAGENPVRQFDTALPNPFLLELDW